MTAQDEDGGTRMLVLPLGIGETVTPLPSPLQGMRAAVTGAVDFTGCEISADALLASLAITCGSRIFPPAPGADRRWRWAG